MPRRWSTRVVGVTFRPNDPVGRLILASEASLAGMAEGAERFTGVLVREPDNPHDGNAVQVHVPGVGHLGYVPRTLAARLAPDLDAGVQWRVQVWPVVHPDHPENPGLSLHCERVDGT